MEKVIVTGGAGFIGSHIVDRLISLGYETHVVDNLFSGNINNLNNAAIFHNVDIRNKEELIPLFENAKYVFHLAGIPGVQTSIEDPDFTHDVNVNGLFNVIEVSRINGVKRIIFASSSAVYGDQKIMPIKEDTELLPVSPYGMQKLIGEIYLRTWATVYKIEAVSLRFFNVYGPRQSAVGAYASVIAKFVDLHRQNKTLTITGDGNQTRDFVYIEDLVDANILAMTKDTVGKGEAINIGNTKSVTVNKIAELIGGDAIYIAPRVEAYDSRADIQKAIDLLGWSPKITIEEGIKLTK